MADQSGKIAEMEFMVARLRGLGLHAPADEVELHAAELRAAQQERIVSLWKATKNEHAANGMTAAHVDDMEQFGVAFGEIRWIPATMNRLENDLPWYRDTCKLAGAAWTTRRTRRFAQALIKCQDPMDLILAGWSGYLVEVRIASADEDFDWEPHWSEQSIVHVYVSNPAQALRLAPVLRDREIISSSSGTVPEDMLWCWTLAQRRTQARMFKARW